MVPDDAETDHRQRAADNERLRNLALQELASTRAAASRLAADQAALDQDLLALAEQLALQRSETEQVIEELATTKTELEETRAELERARAAIAGQGTRITSLQRQNSQPLRLLAKKVLQKAGLRRSDNAR